MLTRKEFFLGAAMVALVPLAGCSGESTKDIPEGMDEAYYDYAKDVYDLCQQYLDGSTGLDTTKAKVDKALDSHSSAMKSVADKSKQDTNVFVMAVFLATQLDHTDDNDKSKENIARCVDGLGYVLETGELSDDYKMLNSDDSQ